MYVMDKSDAKVNYNRCFYINRKSYTGTNTAKLIYFDITSNEGKAAFLNGTTVMNGLESFLIFLLKL